MKKVPENVWAWHQKVESDDNIPVVCVLDVGGKWLFVDVEESVTWLFSSVDKMVAINTGGSLLNNAGAGDGTRGRYGILWIGDYVHNVMSAVYTL